jgi:hypothetical protein
MPKRFGGVPGRLVRTSTAFVLGLVLAGALLGCTGAKSAEKGTVVVMLVDAKGKKLPFDPDAIRAKRAREALDKVAPREVALSIDLALLPDDTEVREAYVADALESIARALDTLGKTDRTSYDAARPLREVSFKFDPLAHRPRAKLSEDGSMLEVNTSRAGQPPLVMEDYIYLLRERGRDLRSARYAEKSPRDVPKEERSAYFAALVDSRTSPREERGRYAWQADRVLTLLELYDLLAKDRDPLASKVEHELVSSQVEVFREVAYHRPEVFDTAPAESSLKRAERAYSAYLQQAIPHLAEEDQYTAAKSAFMRASNHDERPLRYALPSLDRVAVATTLLTEWKRKGGGFANATPALHAVACPEEIVRSGNRWATSQSGFCGDELYHLARVEPEVQKALVAYAKREDDTAFTRLLFARLVRERTSASLGRAFDSARTLYGTRLFAVSVDAMAGALEGSGNEVLVDEARNFVRALPEARGDVAYLVARALTYRQSDETFKRFGDLFGAPLGVSDYERFMAYGDRAVAVTAEIIPAFAETAKGLPRIRVFLTKFDAYLDGEGDRFSRVGPDRTFSDLRDKLCEADDHVAVAEIARAFADRRKRKPGETLTEIFAEGCPKKDPSDGRGNTNKHPKPPAPKVRPKDGGPGSDIADPFSSPRAPRAPRTKGAKP